MQQRWAITKSWPCGPAPGSDRDAAFAFTISDGRETRQSTVEYATPSTRAGLEQARLILAPFLDAETPPRRFVVARDGSFRIAEN